MLVGLLGAPDAGKTAALVSLYLQVANRRLSAFEFRDSKTLLGFEQISRGARRWNDGRAPDQMTAHTELSDDRGAGYLHLRLLRKADGLRFDMLMPDLPGEWSTSLIDANRVDRLAFLKSADVIWIMVDGEKVLQPTTRQYTLHRTKLLLQRVAELISPRLTPIVLVVTRRDRGEPEPSYLEPIQKEAERYHLPFCIVHLASFGDGGQVEAGTGMDELISSGLAIQREEQEFWPDTPLICDRAFLSIRIDGRAT